MANYTLLNVFTNTLESIVNVADPMVMEYIKNNLNQSDLQKRDELANLFCSNHGYYLVEESKCDCDIGFFGKHCSIPGKYYWGEGWTAFQALFTIFYIILAALTWISLYRNLTAEYGSVCKKFKRVFQTPKYLVILNLIVICNSKYFILYQQEFFI